MKILSRILIVAAFLGLAAYSGQDYIANTIRLDGFIYGNKSGGIDSLIVPDTDSLGQYKYQNLKNPSDPLDAVNFRTLLNSSSSGWDSIPFNPATGDQEAYLSGAIIYTTNFNDRYIELSDTNVLSVTISQLNDSIDVLNSKIDNDLLPSVYKITLPINGTLAGSAAAATDVPSGWVLSTSGGNLQINHGLGRYSMNARVKYNTSGNSYRHLKDFEAGYSGLIDVDDDNLTIESISTYYTAAKLQIMLSFE